jgi:Fic family protein
MNYVSAMQFGLNKTGKTKYKNKLLCEIHKLMVDTEPDSHAGEFRKDYLLPGKTVVRTNMDPMYYPTAPEYITVVMRDLEEFVNRIDEMDAIIRAAMVHYQIETISPFTSGNDRIARILTYMILTDKEIFTRPLFCLSHYLYLNKIEYKDRIDVPRYRRDYEQWIKFFTKSIIFAVSNSLEILKNWFQLRENNLHRIEASGTSVKAIKSIYDAIERFPIFDVSTIAKEAGVSYNTGVAALKALIDLQIVKQTNCMKRNRDYAYEGFLNCFLGNDMLRLSERGGI